MLIAPTEPKKLCAIGKVSSMPEKFGVDILFASPLGLAGIQRKELSDYIASIHDGRLGKELVQMKQLSWSGLILEGRPQWTNQDMLMSGRSDWSRSQHTSSLMTVQTNNTHFFATDSLYDTIEYTKQIEKWLQKSDHSNFLNRPKPKGKWGRASSKDWVCHLLQSFEGIGLGTAEAIYDHFQGRIPLRWTVTSKELSAISGIGPKRAAALLAALETEETAIETLINSEFPAEFETDPAIKG